MAAAGRERRPLRRFRACCRDRLERPPSAVEVQRRDRHHAEGRRPGRPLRPHAAAGPTLLLADLAADCGYYDQAHLAREFRELAGLPPSTWLAEEFRNVQAQ